MAEQKTGLLKLVEGYKTYLTAAAILACGVLTQQGIKVPEYCWAALAALGLAFLRAGVEKK